MKTILIKNFRAQFTGYEEDLLRDLDEVLKKHCGANWTYDFDIQE